MPEYSEAERKRRSALARHLHARTNPITGKPVFGGPQPGSGRPRKKRATERINEMVEDHADEIFERMMRALRSNNDFAALKAAQQFTDISLKEAEIQAREERNLEDTPTDELVGIVASRLARLTDAGHIPFDIEGEAVEVGAGELNAGQSEDDEEERLTEDRNGIAGLGASPFAGRTPER